MQNSRTSVWFRFAAGALCASLLAGPGAAQMSVSTFGATDAVSCFENAANDFSEDAGPCDAALKRGDLTRGDRMKTLVNRGIIRNRTGDLQAAIDDFDAALDIDDTLGEAWLNRGNSWFLAGRHDAAIADYETALANDVRKPWAAWYNIGLARAAMGDKAGARAAYEEALRINPGFTAAARKLAELGGE